MEGVLFIIHENKKMISRSRKDKQLLQRGCRFQRGDHNSSFLQHTELCEEESLYLLCTVHRAYCNVLRLAPSLDHLEFYHSLF